MVVGGCFSECGDGFDRRLRLMTCEDKRWSDRVDLLLKVVSVSIRGYLFIECTLARIQ